VYWYTPKAHTYRKTPSTHKYSTLLKMKKKTPNIPKTDPEMIKEEGT
jgi:hypothetical protein